MSANNKSGIPVGHLIIPDIECVLLEKGIPIELVDDIRSGILNIELDKRWCVNYPDDINALLKYKRRLLLAADITEMNSEEIVAMDVGDIYNLLKDKIVELRKNAIEKLEKKL